jgi:hypothetical protein
MKPRSSPHRNKVSKFQFKFKVKVEAGALNVCVPRQDTETI